MPTAIENGASLSRFDVTEAIATATDVVQRLQAVPLDAPDGAQQLFRVIVPGLLQIAALDSVALFLVDPDGFGLSLAECDPVGGIDPSQLEELLDGGMVGFALNENRTIDVTSSNEPAQRWVLHRVTTRTQGYGVIIGRGGVGSTFPFEAQQIFSLVVVAYSHMVENRYLYHAVEEKRVVLVGTVEEKLQELRRVSEALEVSIRVKQDFLSNINHELRTPLNGIQGLAGLLLETTLDSDQRTCMETIVHSVDHLASLIEDMLDFSRLERREIKGINAPFDLRALVDQVVHLFAHRVTDKGLELRLGYDASLPQRVVGDVGRIRQILCNLIDNAIKFTYRGHVAVDVRRRTPSGVSFVVTDTGIGVAADNLSDVFTAFSQADTSSRRVFGGTGLGLALSHELAALMGGSLLVSSTLVVGSTFTLDLP
jgi:signal transduction histidine kinase